MSRYNGSVQVCLLAVQERFRIAEVAAERERCAKIAENHGTCAAECAHDRCLVARRIAAKIRSGE